MEEFLFDGLYLKGTNIWKWSRGCNKVAMRVRIKVALQVEKSTREDISVSTKYKCKVNFPVGKLLNCIPHRSRGDNTTCRFWVAKHVAGTSRRGAIVTKTIKMRQNLGRFYGGATSRRPFGDLVEIIFLLKKDIAFSSIFSSKKSVLSEIRTHKL